jgi:uncharacterized membrane protein
MINAPHCNYQEQTERRLSMSSLWMKGLFALAASIFIVPMMTTGLLLPPVSAVASLTVNPGLTVSNRCDRDITIAVHYKSHNGWSTTSFVNVRARGQQERVASSNNSIFLYYAQTISGHPELRWAGDQSQTVDGKVYPMRSTQLALDRERNRFLLQINCPRA